jgi:hypothetical protein
MSDAPAPDFRQLATEARRDWDGQAAAPVEALMGRLRHLRSQVEELTQQVRGSQAARRIVQGAEMLQDCTRQIVQASAQIEAVTGRLGQLDAEGNSQQLSEGTGAPALRQDIEDAGGSLNRPAKVAEEIAQLLQMAARELEAAGMSRQAEMASGAYRHGMAFAEQVGQVSRRVASVAQSIDERLLTPLLLAAAKVPELAPITQPDASGPAVGAAAPPLSEMNHAPAPIDHAAAAAERSPGRNL